MKRVTMNVVHEGRTMYELGSFDINDTMANTISAHATMAAQLQAAMRELELLSGDRAEITEAIRSRNAAIAALESKLEATEARIGRLRKLALRTHRTCEDSFYSCPKSPEGCYNEGAGTECNCGADEHNAEVERICNDTPPQAEGASDGRA